jgi:hypothetical protein
MTIFIVIAYGLMPFISAMPFGRGFLLIGIWALPLNGSILLLYGPDGEASFLVVTISLLLCAFSAASAIWSSFGDKEGRVATLFFVTLDVVWWTGLIVFVIFYGDLTKDDVFRLVIEPIPPLFWLGFVWWNYTRPEISEYYTYQASLEV